MYVPHEIFVEILSWVTVESLLRCKCVCKQWQAMILDPKFVEMHMERNKGISHYTKRHDETLTISGIKDTYSYRDSLDGLLLQKSTSEHKYIVRNPSIKQVIVVPSPHLSVVYTFIYFHSSSSTYRLMSIHTSTVVSTISGGQILELGASDLSWRPFNIFPCDHDLDQYTYRLRFQSCPDVLYVFRSPLGNSISSRNAVIFSIDLQKEEVCTSVVTVPVRFFSNWSDVELISWDGKMALICLMEKELVAWVLEDYNKQKWSDTKIVIPFLNVVEITSVLFPWKSCAGVLWIYLNKNTWYLYFIEAKILLRSVSKNSNTYNRVANNATLVKIDGMRPEIEEIRD